MEEPIAEYTVRNYSAVDHQIEQIAQRERVLTNRLKIANYKQIIFLAGGALLAIGVFLVLAGIAYSVAFPKLPKVIEKTEVIEKVIEPQKIIIQTPQNSVVTSGNPATSGVDTNAAIWGNTNGSVSSSTKDTTSHIVDNSDGGGNNSAKINEKTSVLGSRLVTTFTNVPAGINGFKSVVTGWRWNDKNASAPFEQYCYVEKDGTLDEAITLGLQGLSKTPPASTYSSSVANIAGLSKSEWDQLFKKCRWFPT